MSELKIKLVAIAKDEGAYLPEWIAHHLYFGFDSIDVYINNTTDNSCELSELLSSLINVNFKDGDFFFSNFSHAQSVIYHYAFNEAKEENYTHIIFLDIDEFWTPKDFNKDIKFCIKEIDSDIISFEWFNKFDDQDFSPAIEYKMAGEHHSLVKSILSLDVEYSNIDIHNSKSETAIYKLADGVQADYYNNNQHVVVDDGDIKPYFITHRMFRSQREYVSMLGRGRPKNHELFKDNRNGFCKVKNPVKEVVIDENSTAQYFAYINNFYEEYITNDYMDNAKQFILERYDEVLVKIESAALNDLPVLRKVLNGVDMPDVNQAFSGYLIRVARNFNKRVVDSIRDAAIAIENNDLPKSLELMEVALSLRPKGPLLIKKIKQYRAKLEKN